MTHPDNNTAEIFKNDDPDEGSEDSKEGHEQEDFPAGSNVGGQCFETPLGLILWVM